MNPYEGLNLPDLIALMHGLALPEPVSWLPETPGWWILLGWLLAVLMLTGWRLVKHHHRNRYRREALAELKAIADQPALSPNELAQQISVLLRRTALAAYAREQIAPLYGTAWAQFLKNSANDDSQIGAAADGLATASYHPDADGRTLVAPARRWIRLHRV